MLLLLLRKKGRMGVGGWTLCIWWMVMALKRRDGEELFESTG